MVQPKDLLTPAEITALTVIYKTYKLKQKVQRKAVEHSFYLATGKKLGRVYYAIPIVQKLLEPQRPQNPPHRQDGWGCRDN